MKIIQDQSDISFDVSRVETRHLYEEQDGESPTVRVFRHSPDAVQLQFRSGRRYHTVSLPFETANAIAAALLFNAKVVKEKEAKR